jgi:hypothetical protein
MTDRYPFLIFGSHEIYSIVPVPVLLNLFYFLLPVSLQNTNELLHVLSIKFKIAKYPRQSISLI